MTTRRFSTSTVPKLPGIYAMYDDTGGVAYVGTSKDLRARIEQHLTRKDSSVTTGVTILMLAALAVAIPNFVRTRVTPAQNSCINNLRQIDGAKQQWALQNRKSNSDVPTLADILPYLAREMRCPQGMSTDTFRSSYEIGAVTNHPKCKIRPAEHVLE